MKIPDYSKKQKQPTYLEMQQEIERLNNDIKELLKENSNKEKVIIAQDNIIKEVREFIEWHYEDNKNFYKNKGIGLNYPECDYILEILDKENNKTNEVMPIEELEEYEPKNMAEQEYQDWFWD